MLPVRFALPFFQTKARAAFAAYFLSALLLVSTRAEARLNLPQRALVVTLRKEAAAAVRDYFARAGADRELTPPIQELILDSLPRDLQGACAGLMESWGNTLSGTEVWRVHVLSQQPKQVWLGFRCGTRFPDWLQYYDERLAALRLDAATLEFLPLGPDSEGDADLYHLEFVEPLALEGGEASVFRVTVDSDNPCCGGPTQVSEEKLMVFVESPHGSNEALSVLTRRKEDDHDDVEGDTETVYRARASFEPDTKGWVTSVVATFREEVNGKLQRSGTLRYRWDPASRKFEAVR